jgi:hypothetical protein
MEPPFADLIWLRRNFYAGVTGWESFDPLAVGHRRIESGEWAEEGAEVPTVRNTTQDADFAGPTAVGRRKGIFLGEGIGTFRGQRSRLPHAELAGSKVLPENCRVLDSAVTCSLVMRTAMTGAPDRDQMLLCASLPERSTIHTGNKIGRIEGPHRAAMTRCSHDGSSTVEAKPDRAERLAKTGYHLAHAENELG